MSPLRLLPFVLVVLVGCEKQSPTPPSDSAADVGPPAADDGADGLAEDDGVPAPALKAAGESCLAASECDSGICEGEGCGDDTPGTCAEADRMCTRDYVKYCGCDGENFGGSGSCPDKRYAHKGDC